MAESPDVVMHIVPGKSLEDISEDFKKRLIIHSIDLCALCDEIEAAGFTPVFQFGKMPPLGKYAVTVLKLTKDY